MTHYAPSVDTCEQCGERVAVRQLDDDGRCLTCRNNPDRCDPRLAMLEHADDDLEDSGPIRTDGGTAELSSFATADDVNERAPDHLEEDDRWCKGPQMLEDGELCCWPCFRDATDEQRAEYRRLSDNSVYYQGEAQ
jgi:hypothetical protein